MIKTTIFAGLLAAVVAPGGTMFDDQQAAIRHAVERFKVAKARAERICYNHNNQDMATGVLMLGRLPDGQQMAFEVLKTPEGYHVEKVLAPAAWPHKVACQDV